MEPITLEINQIRAVVFDLDNTLVTSSLDFVSMRQALGCPEQEDLLSFVDKLPDAAQRAHAQHIILQHEMADAQSSTPLPGCHALLAFIKQRSWRCAIVTRNCLAASELKLAHNDIEVEKLITRGNIARLNLIPKRCCNWPTNGSYDTIRCCMSVIICMIYKPQTMPICHLAW